MQFHYGDAVEGGDLGWHVDGINSLLHLALSIRGACSSATRLRARPPRIDTGRSFPDDPSLHGACVGAAVPSFNQ